MFSRSMGVLGCLGRITGGTKGAVLAPPGGMEKGQAIETYWIDAPFKDTCFVMLRTKTVNRTTNLTSKQE